MVTEDVNSEYKAKVESLERTLLFNKETESRNFDLDIAILRVLKEVNLQFANWLVESTERQQRAPREILNDILVLALQAKQ